MGKSAASKVAGVVLCMLTMGVNLYAVDELSVSGFTSIYISASSSGGIYSIHGTSVYAGSTFLTGGSFQVTDGILNATETVPLTLENAHVYPNPCNIAKGCLSVRFTKITTQANLKIYTISGELVRSYDKNNAENFITWDLKNDRGSEVASGLYVYYVKTSNSSKKGKLIVIR